MLFRSRRFGGTPRGDWYEKLFSDIFFNLYCYLYLHESMAWSVTSKFWYHKVHDFVKLAVFACPSGPAWPRRQPSLADMMNTLTGETPHAATWPTTLFELRLPPLIHRLNTNPEYWQGCTTLQRLHIQRARNAVSLHHMLSHLLGLRELLLEDIHLDRQYWTVLATLSNLQVLKLYDV